MTTQQPRKRRRARMHLCVAPTVSPVCGAARATFVTRDISKVDCPTCKAIARRSHA